MKIEISEIGRAFDGVSFGAVGSYQKIVGRAFGEADPRHPLNAGIVNLDNAPTNAAGRVEYQVDFCLLTPADPGRANGHILYDVLNRGNKLALAVLNDARGGNDPVKAADAGNGFLMRNGYTILWSAWQGDVAAGEGRMLANFPIATDAGNPLVTLNRDEFVFGHDHNPARAVLSYPAAGLDQGLATLTVRQREKDPRVAIPRGSWRYLSDRKIEITRPGGFDAGAIYEFIYPARDPIVMGLGFAAVRDVVSYFRYERFDAEGRPNPIGAGADGPTISHVIAFGESQSGRFLRDFLWQGFNQDLSGRMVFDGLMASLAGSRKTFTNYPFAQPGRFSQQHEDHLTPGDQFPFSYATRFDPISGKTEGILERCRATNTAPKIMHVDSSGEFWQARASLIVTDESGKDIDLPDNVRVYLFSSTQHGGGFATQFFPFAEYPGNHIDISAGHRALLIALDQWVSRAVLPPASRFPRVADGTLVKALPQAVAGFPPIPGITYTGLLNELSEVDYREQPPRPIAGHDYVVLVPAVDADGNEVAGIRLPDVAAPMGTHTGWNPRRDGFAPGDLCLLGAYIAFAPTAAQRRSSGDPRLSVQERYTSRDRYVAEIARAAHELLAARLLLAEDVERYIDAAAKRPLPVGRMILRCVFKERFL